VAGDETRGTEAGDGAETERDDGHLREVVAHLFPAGIARHVGATGVLIGFHRAAAACAVDQAHDGNTELARHPLGDHLLLMDRRVRRATAHREVVATHRDRATIYATAAADEVRGLEVEQLAVLVVLRLATQGADLVEAAGIEQSVDTLPYRELA